MKTIETLTGKQRSYLKGLANGVKPIAQIGKSGITENFIKQIDDALEARELIKVNVLENSLLDTKETANEVAKQTRAYFIQAIGNKFVIYRPSNKNPEIQIPR
ncbi:ribosome assembly RNA-binding protein YhbY [Crassaminicella profunda]|uniref:ribosome assembly RNA-binding protein YhbY n=1 Tax=Crassaminicella profunda TaxID=1286698 RepID=UPI001CA77C37|nr:ribosome assembly RNA-binding protein YhbY [Crassaminicella profunda]QZY57081.1 ribosome assembly RNA-binding protein YhbY [Crassaminicella profunda]